MAKWSMDKTNLTIDTKQEYTRDSLLALLKEKLGSEFGELESRDKVIMNGEIIVAQGVDGYENYIVPKKKKIRISQIQTSAKNRVGTFALDAATSGWSTLLGTKGIKGNQAVMQKLAEAIEEIVS
ncbi:MAG: hypothetical protein LBD02_02840 [Christensenellaceae bacterium]|jgi:hypothetical protein|nr:hypothetical protein [Christensenellaceae bacterium]